MEKHHFENEYKTIILHKLRLVALDSPRSGALHGVQGADYECIRQAAQNKFVGSFRGFLAPPHSGREETLM